LRHLLTILTFFFGFIAFGQDVAVYEEEQNRHQVDIWNARAAQVKVKDSIYFYYNKAIIVARSIDYFNGELTACKGLIELYKNDKEVYERLRYTLLLVRLYEKKSTVSELVSGYQKLGKLYFDERLYAKASEIFVKGFETEGTNLNERYNAGIWLARSLRFAGDLDDALVTARKIQFEKNLSAYQQIELQQEKAEIYHRLRAYEEELTCYREIIRAASGTKYAYFKPATWNNIGFVCKYLNRIEESKEAFLNAILTAKKDDVVLKATAYYNVGMIYHNQDMADSAMVQFKKAEELYRGQKDWASVASSLNMMSLSFYHNGDMFNGQKHLDKAFQLERQHGLKQQEAKSFEIQSLFAQDLYDFEYALDSYKKYLSIRDSLLTVERTEEFRLLFDQYKVEQIEKQLRLIWASNDLEMANLAKERAQLEAQQEKDARELKENELEIAGLQYQQLKDREALKELQLLEQRLNLENKQKELNLIQRDNELKELALEKERLEVLANEKEIRFLAQQNELERQRRVNEKQDYQYKLQLFIGALLFIFIFLIVISIAYRQMRRRKKQIEAQSVIITESKKEIEIQKDKSDGLLLNILPIAIAEELKKNGVAKPKLYNDVSVGFTDFSGFTMISEQLSPEELVEKLDGMFLEFDKISEKYGLQRIKTIGDAYMFAAGLPEPKEDHAESIVKAAIEIRNFIDGYNKTIPSSAPRWNIRIGIHSGPVVAGVIGIKKFAYDIWGDTVNTAARMESSGQVGKVNVSGTTFSKIKHQFQTEHRGKVAAKNKGDIDMYFVETL